MSSSREEGPVYYREIQKNAYLKRIPDDFNGGKLRPLVHKKPPLKPMWTLFCVHNGKIPYLEQYPQQDCSSTHAHRPLWRACLKTTRHVTASVKPLCGQEYDFLIDTDVGPVRMLAPDWDAMQDWVTTLRNKLHELRILSRGENVYGAPPVAPLPRAAARDPNSPLPPTPPVPVDRVPGIELGPNVRPVTESSTENTTTNSITTTAHINPEPENHRCINNVTTVTDNANATNLPAQSEARETLTNARNLLTVNTTNVNSTLNDINVTTSLTNVRNALNSIVTSDIDISNWDATPSTSRETDNKTRDKIESKSVAKICGQNVCLDDSILKRTSRNSDDKFFAELDRISDSVDDDDFTYTQRLRINDDEIPESSDSQQRSNITVIQVSNKVPPHTAIPVLGHKTDVFDFNFKQNLQIKPDFVNIVNTEQNDYGTVFENSDSEYGHISLTTTVSVTRPDVNSVTDVTSATNVSAVVSAVTNGCSVTNVNGDKGPNDAVYERLCMASTSNASPLPVRRLQNVDKVRKSSLPNLDLSESTYECLFPSQTNSLNNAELNSKNVQNSSNKAIIPISRPSSNVSSVPILNSNITSNGGSVVPILNSNINSNGGSVVPISNCIPSSNVSGPVSISNLTVSNVDSFVSNVRNSNNAARPIIDSNVRGLRSNIERSHSQNAYDVAPGVRERRRLLNNSPKAETKNDKPETPHQKPIWRRGLTELSLLTRLKSISLKRQESPSRQNNENDRSVTSSVKVVHRSRGDTRVDSSRRRSNSLSNGQAPRIPQSPPTLLPLRARQAASLLAEQRRGACVATTVPVRDPPLFCDYEKQIWVARWGGAGVRCGGRVGDRLAAVGGTQPTSAQHARHLIKGSNRHMVDLLFHRVPLGKIYVITKKDHESLGIKLDNECTIQSVDSDSPASRVGLPPGKWAVTEVNNRPVNLLKGGEEEMNRLSARGTEVSILIQPTALVKKLRAATKGRPLLAIR
ncbi:uncharacterized protein LOC111001069 [Pieris rapae]|uniref:uncharacterized protein LOC111001069 n=1 Tax=Pieris rapae TaxID=64459 RepID=UPI001E27A304|nr:uncharacterized protein LOC111001069 [Pieris rapae]